MALSSNFLVEEPLHFLPSDSGVIVSDRQLNSLRFLPQMFYSLNTGDRFGFPMTASVATLIILSGTACTFATTPSHDFHYIYACYDSGDLRVDVLIDGEVAAYADFSKDEVVWATPHLPKSVLDFKKRAYAIAKTSFAHCQSSIDKARNADPDALMRQEAPESFIYTRYEGEASVMNTLFCLANHFYPPSINFTWTKNGMEVTEGVSNLRYQHNSDGTFHRISTLSFTPREGDVFSCSVEHQASRRPLTRSWELDVRKSSMTPAAGFFVASLILCLIGIGAGAIFFTKQPK